MQIDRAGKGMVPMKQLKVWSDNAGDLKSSDVWDQWRKILSAQDDQTGLSHAVLRYHAKQGWAAFWSPTWSSGAA